MLFAEDTQPKTVSKPKTFSVLHLHYGTIFILLRGIFILSALAAVVLLKRGGTKQSVGILVRSRTDDNKHLKTQVVFFVATSADNLASTSVRGTMQ